jgi:hypothetical protein
MVKNNNQFYHDIVINYDTLELLPADGIPDNVQVMMPTVTCPQKRQMTMKLQALLAPHSYHNFKTFRVKKMLL